MRTSGLSFAAPSMKSPVISAGGPGCRRSPGDAARERGAWEPCRRIRPWEPRRGARREVSRRAEAFAEDQYLPEVARPDPKGWPHAERGARGASLRGDFFPADLGDPTVARDL